VSREDSRHCRMSFSHHCTRRVEARRYAWHAGAHLLEQFLHPCAHFLLSRVCMSIPVFPDALVSTNDMCALTWGYYLVTNPRSTSLNQDIGWIYRIYVPLSRGHSRPRVSSKRAARRQPCLSVAMGFSGPGQGLSTVDGGWWLGGSWPRSCPARSARSRATVDTMPRSTVRLAGLWDSYRSVL